MWMFTGADGTRCVKVLHILCLHIKMEKDNFRPILASFTLICNVIPFIQNMLVSLTNSETF